MTNEEKAKTPSPEGGWLPCLKCGYCHTREMPCNKQGLKERG